MNKLTGKVAVVTGASKGIGAALAKGVAEAGAAVAVNYAADKEGAERTVLEITRGGGQAVAIQADVSKAADVKRLFAETQKAFGSIDVLVNNAGIFQFEPFEEITEQDFHRAFDINVLGTILCTQEALKYFPRSGGSVINIELARESQSRAAFRALPRPRAPSIRSRWPSRRSLDRGISG